MKNIVEVTWLHENMDKVVIVDATNNFMVHGEGRKKYEAEHIPGAFHIDLHADMVGTVAEHGGRDPLPDDISTFASKLEEFGISNDTPIVVYDDNLVPSSRFWWMCKYIGVNNVKVLNGGIMAWKRAGYPLTDEVTPKPQSGKIGIRLDSSMLADVDDIKRAINYSQVAIVDSRTKDRFLGIDEPIDVKAGHIPSALNYYYGEVLDPITGYKDKEFLERHFAALKKYDETIVHCGSGVSGSVNIIAMDEVGIRCKFYIGSWSDYITYPDSIIEKE